MYNLNWIVPYTLLRENVGVKYVNECKTEASFLFDGA